MSWALLEVVVKLLDDEVKATLDVALAQSAERAGRSVIVD
jgi:hypothetical protein